jgi:hypothetical protein
MVDIETLGLDRDSAIISIGAVRFDAGRLGLTFHRQISLESNRDHGRTVDEGTWDWWIDEQGADESFLREGDDLETVLADFAAWYGNAEEVWANAPSFDCEALEHAYAQTEYNEPWAFYEERDVRTVKNLPGVEEPEFEGTEHNALDDAKHQARLVNRVLGAMEVSHADD